MRLLRSTATSYGDEFKSDEGPAWMTVVPKSLVAMAPLVVTFQRRMPTPPELSSAIHTCRFVPEPVMKGPLRLTLGLGQLSGRSTCNSELEEIVWSKLKTMPLPEKSFT